MTEPLWSKRVALKNINQQLINKWKQQIKINVVNDFLGKSPLPTLFSSVCHDDYLMRIALQITVGSTMLICWMITERDASSKITRKCG